MLPHLYDTAEHINGRNVKEDLIHEQRGQFRVAMVENCADNDLDEDWRDEDDGEPLYMVGE